MSDINNSDLNCANCGGTLKFEGAENALVCESCSASFPVSDGDENIIENDYLSTIQNLDDNTSNNSTVYTVHCNSCGANTTLKLNEVASECPYCSENLNVQQKETHNALKPEYVLPFKIEKEEAHNLFKKWIKSLWWAPNKLTELSRQVEKLNGVYYPYWTYDSNTFSAYTGQRGDNYIVTESYQSRDSNGNSVTKTRQVTKIRWSHASGDVNDYFDDVLVVGSESLPTKYLHELEPWDLHNLKEFDSKYFAGYRAETYFIGVKKGLERAKIRMYDIISTTIRRDIGGDHQRISSVNTSYSDIKFKHILLPIWISAYKYKDKIYRIVINGRTGEVQGERPYSWIKITLAILAVVGVIGLIWYLDEQGIINLSSP